MPVVKGHSSVAKRMNSVVQAQSLASLVKRQLLLVVDHTGLDYQARYKAVSYVK